VITNLLDNALKYSPPEEPVEVVVGATAKEASVEVRDRGIGLEPAEMSRLFTKYGRIRNARTARVAGTGLGLYLSRLLVHAHGGSIAATSAGRDQGTTFVVRLPRARPGRRGQRSAA
jgi:signal transduction histidine kinase